MYQYVSQYMPLISCFTFTPGLSTHQPGWCWLWPRLGPRACRHRYTWSNGTDDGNHPIEAHGGFSELKSTLTLGLSIYIKKKNYLHGFHGIQHYICCLYLVSLVLHTYIYIYIYSCIPTKSLVRNPLSKHRDSQTVWMEL